MTHKEKILELRKEGKSYNEISKILNCSKSTISFHCGEGQKEKHRKRRIKYRKKHPYIQKIEYFRNTIEYQKLFQSKLPLKRLLYYKMKTFTQNKEPLSLDEVIKKLGENPVCYLTGRPIDITKTRSYQFDHIVPRSKGGDNSLENLGIATKEANQAKSNLYVDDFIKLCIDVVENFGYTVSKNPNLPD